MKLPGLIDLSLIMILASHSKGEKWTIHVDQRINATVNSDVTIMCNFTMASEFATENPEVYWKKKKRSTFDTKDNDKNAYVYHPNATFVLKKYSGNTELIGNIKNGNCTLKIKKIMESDDGIYVRVIANDGYSFWNNLVTITVNGSVPVPPVPDNAGLPTSELTTEKMTEMPLTTTTTEIYIAIFVPVAALLLIILVTGIVFWRKRRSMSIAREGSGYYANFRRASSNQDNRDASCKKQDTKNLPESKNIDEPVYINLEVPPGQMHQSDDHTDNVYANVDYLKQ